MKKFLQDLKNELTKMNLNKKEIEEILSDHQEMIEQATKEGLSEDELTAKFGDPAKLARELRLDTTNYENEGEKNMKDGFELFKSFPVIEDLKEIEIKLVSEDVEYQEHDQESIEVYFNNISNTDDYICEYSGGKFILRREKGSFKGIFSSKNKSVIIMVPRNQHLTEFKFTTVSGDVEATKIEADEFHFNTTSGDLEVNNVQVVNGLIKTVSGDVEISVLHASTLKLSSISGDLEILGGSVEGEMEVNTVSGDVEVSNFEAGETTLSTVSGDLEGKNFYPTKLNLKSVSGDIEISNDDKSRIIEIGRKKTVSGDITID